MDDTLTWDTHCHVDRYDDPISALNEADQRKVGVIAVTEHPGHCRVLRTRLRGRANVEVALGLHPLREHRRPDDLLRFLRLLPQFRWIGEVGLDYTVGDAGYQKEQRQDLEAILQADQVRKRVLTVHSRKAESDVIKMLREADVRGILHWFSGGPRFAEEAVASGLWFSINMAMARTKKGQDLLGNILPKDRVVLETDGPFARIGPDPLRPADIHNTVVVLSRIWNAPRADVNAVLLRNQQRLVEVCG